MQAAHQYLQSAPTAEETRGATLFDLLKATPEQGPEMLSPEVLYDKIENNLRKGRIKVVIASDIIPDTLKDTVHFINSFSNFDIYVLQVQSFKKDQLEIYAPAIFGFTRKSGPGTSPERGQWNEETFFNATASLNEEALHTIRELYEFCKQNAAEVRWGRGRVLA